MRKSGETLVIEEEKKKVAEARLGEVSQLVLFGSSGISTPALQECMRREIPETFMSYGGWFIGHTVGSGHRNVEIRTCQYRSSFDAERCLKLSRSLVAAKIANCRIMLRRNRKTDDPATQEALLSMQGDMKQAMRAGPASLKLNFFLLTCFRWPATESESKVIMIRLSAGSCFREIMSTG